MSKAFLFIVILMFVIGAIGCGTPEPPKANSNSNSAANLNKNSGLSEFNTQKKPEEAKVNDAQAIGPVILAYYEALKKKDDAGLKKVFSQPAVKELEAETKGEGKKSIAEYIAASEPAGDKPFEVRNEKIEGDTATAEIKGGSYAVWTKWKFVKENGEWKIAPPSESLKLLGK